MRKPIKLFHLKQMEIEGLHMAKGIKTGGRAPGSPNKVSQEARQAIASFVDGNAHRLTGWLDQVAEGIPKAEDDGYWVQPNPAKAFELFQSVVEYHIPKLARTEHTGKDGDSINLVHRIERVIL